MGAGWSQMEPDGGRMGLKAFYAFFSSTKVVSSRVAPDPRRDVFFPILGPLGRARDFREGGPEGNFGQKAVRAQRFLPDVCAKTGNSEKTWKSLFSFSESIISRVPGAPQVVPWGTPGHQK